MNRVILSGWLRGDAVERFLAGGRASRVCFDLVVRDGAGADVSVKVEVDSPEVIQHCAGLLTSGRVVFVEGEESSREVRKRDVLEFVARFVRAERIEIPDRRRAGAAEMPAGVEGVV